MPRPRSYRIALSHRERETIRHFRRKKTTSYYAKMRCSILLAADESNSNNVPTYQEIAAKSGTSVPTVIDTIKKYSEIGFRGAIEPARNSNSNTSRLKATGDVEAKIIAQACKPAPEGYARWTVTLVLVKHFCNTYG